MAVQKFEDLIVWQKSQDTAVFIYAKFGAIRDFGFRDQICRAAVSTSNNIAEGFEKGSNRDFTRFLRIAKGSCSEVKSMLYLASRLSFISEADQINGLQQAAELGKILNGLIRSMIPPVS